MISCIICSRTPDISDELKQNVASTIGVDYELVIIDNSQKKYSIFSAYNEGVRRANGNILCFMHDDIKYHTTNWGESVNDYFDNDNKLGCLGVAGCHYFPCVPTYWCYTPFITTTHIQNEDGISVPYYRDFYFGDKQIIEAVCCDGLWLCMRKKLFEQIQFDTKSFRGFHYYDMDICMQIIAIGYKVCIPKNIIIEHFGRGVLNKDFYNSSVIFYNKWKDKLPMVKGVDQAPYIFESIEFLFQEQFRYKKLLQSKSYRLGKSLLTPFSYIKRKMHK